MTTPESQVPVRLSDGARDPSFRRALKNRDFSFFWVGQFGSEVGNGAVQLALPFLVFQLTGSALQLGFAYFFLFLPMLLFGIVGGVFVDRWDRRITIVVVDVARGIAFLSVAFIYYADGLTVYHLYAVLFLDSTLANFYNPARAALVPNLVDQDDLRPANSLMEISRHIGFFIAPPVGAVVAGFLGPASIMLINGVTFLTSALCIWLIRWRQPKREHVRSEGFKQSVVTVASQTKDGLAVIGRSKLLQVSMFLGFSLNLIVSPIQLLLPLFVTNVKHRDEAYFGLLVAGLLVGLIVGSLAAPALAKRVGLGRLAIVMIVLLGIVISIAAWPATLWPPVAAMLIAGIAIGSLNVAQTTMIQSSTTDEERGRVSATYFTTTLGVRPISFLVMGIVATAVDDIRILFVALGVMAMVVGLVLVRIPEVREHD